MWTAPEEGLGRVFLIVRADRRRTGIGAELWATVERHLLGHGARRLVCPADDDEPAGGSFLAARGFRPGRRDVQSRLDPRTVEPVQPPPGVELVRLGELAERSREVFEVYAAGEADVPTEEAGTNMSFEEWAYETLGNPDLSREGSFVALVDGRPAALTFLLREGESDRATNEMTATLLAYRGRGLATLAKVATSRWAAEHGLRAIYTTNDETNAPMLAVNRKLGYVPIITTTHWVRDEPAR